MKLVNPNAPYSKGKRSNNRKRKSTINLDSPANSTTSPAHIEKAILMKKALELRMQYFTFPQIGEQLGISQSHAYNLVNEGINSLPVEKAESYKKMITSSLEELLKVSRKLALKDTPDEKQQHIFLKALEDLSNIHGLKSIKQEIEVNNKHTIIGENVPLEELDLPIEVLKQIRIAIKKHQEKNPKKETFLQ